MESLIITPKSQKEFDLIYYLLKRIRIGTKVLTDEEKEDLGMAILMREVDRTKKTSKEDVMKKLKEQ